MSQTRKTLASVALLTALGSIGVGGYQASQVEPPASNIGQVSVVVVDDHFTAEDFDSMSKTPRRLHQWMQTNGEKQARNHR